MKKIIKTKHAELIEKEFKKIPNYLHYFGTPEAMTFEFSSDENEAEVMAVMAQMKDEKLEKIIAKEKKIESFYNEMVDGVYSEMELKLGSRSDSSVTADVQTWQLMLMSPGDFIGGQLDSEAKVKAFANNKLKAAIEYVKARLKKIEEFKSKKSQEE